MSLPFVITIILNTNRREDTLACLESLLANTYWNHKAIVLDNHSTDGSVKEIRSAFPQVQILELEQNLGYAGNNNVGIRAAMQQRADWIFVLNEDTVLAPDCLAQLIEVGERDSRIGVLGPMVYHHDEPDVIQSAGGVLGRYWQSIHLAKDESDHGQYSHPHAVEWISGCAILVRRLVIEGVGMIDERFFYYWEETEWCLRAGKAGWRIVHVPQAKIWHKGVQRNYHPKPTLTYYSTRNRLLMLSKHRAPFRAWAFTCIQLLRTLTSWTIRPKWRHLHTHRAAMWRGLVDFLYHRWGGPVQF
jgi:GT2 family glycosyltransferase